MLLLPVDGDDRGVETKMFSADLRCQRTPHRPCAAALGELKGVVGSPTHIVSLQEYILQHALQIYHRHPLADPSIPELFDRIGPDFVVVGGHKYLSQPVSHHLIDPASEILGRRGFTRRALEKATNRLV